MERTLSPSPLTPLTQSTEYMMEVFFSSQDGSLTWNSSYPEFTECFQDTVLVLVPCGWLWVTSPFYLYYIYSRSRPPLHTSRLGLAKCVSILISIASFKQVLPPFPHQPVHSGMLYAGIKRGLFNLGRTNNCFV